MQPSDGLTQDVSTDRRSTMMSTGCGDLVAQSTSWSASSLKLIAKVASVVSHKLANH